jgi:hypothetical protein
MEKSMKKKEANQWVSAIVIVVLTAFIFGAWRIIDSFPLIP